VSDLHRVDVHHHILPTGSVSALAGIDQDGGYVPFPAWSAEAALAGMDDHGIRAAVTLISAPGIHFGDATFARDLARRSNEVCARLADDHPMRFGASATLPLRDVRGALVEREHALDMLQLHVAVLLAGQSLLPGLRARLARA